MSTIDLVPDGFKQSDVGVIPKTWDIKPFGECFNIIAGLGFSKSEYTQSGLNLLRIDNVSYGKVIWDSIAHLPENYVDKYPHLILEAGDLLLALNRPITNGKLKLAKLAPHDLPSILYQRVGKISTSDKNIDLNFAFFLLTKFIKLFVEESAVGTDQPFISTTKLKKCVLPMPPKEEQTAIANALSDVDALLTELEKLIAKKQAIKTATMQQLLTGKTRLPQFATHTEGKSQGQPKGTKPSELGEIPEDWSVMTIGDIANVKTGPFGSALHEKDYVNDGTPIITVEHLGEKGITYQNLPMVSDADKLRLKAYQLFEGDIVFSRVGSIDRNALVTKDESGWLFSGRLLRVKLKLKNQNPSFFSHQFHTEPFKARVREVAVGQTMPSLNTEILKNILVAVPKYHEEQTAIATILSDMDSEIQTLEQRLAKTRQIKQGMMQELLTGRTRLPY